MSEELKPCPFCGEVPDLPSGDGTQYEIECGNCAMAMASVQICDLMTGEERSAEKFTNHRYSEQYVERAKAEAIKQWNTRATLSPAHIEDERELFERFYLKQVAGSAHSLRKNDAGHYEDDAAMAAWCGWQARAALSAPPAADGMCNADNPASRCECREEFGHRVCTAPPAAGVPEGWKLVPVEPTPEMLEAGDGYLGTPATYKAMLSAATQPPHAMPITAELSQFLSAVMDAAGLVRHGRRSKELSEYLGQQCMKYRAGFAPTQPASEQQQAVVMPELTEQEREDLDEFYEAVCCDAGHRVSKEGMKRLAEIGAVESVGFGKHRMTEFGTYLLGITPTASQQQRAVVMPEGLREALGKAASSWLYENDPQGLDWCDPRNVDALLDALFEAAPHLATPSQENDR